MKRKLSWLFLGIVLLLGIAAAINIETGNLYIQNSDTDTVKIRVRTAATQTAPWLEFNNNGTLAFSLPATGLIPVAYGGTAAATAGAARTNLGTALQWRQHLGLIEAQVTNTILPVANGGTGVETLGAALIAMGVQMGTNIFSDDSTVTNTFGTAFLAAPFVTMTEWGSGEISNSVIVSVSTSNFVAWGQTNAPFHWHAIGAQ